MLCAITSYFNPAGYRRRLQNYKIFRERLGVPLVTAELAFDGEFELSPDDADVLVQLDCGDVMWQKERLLNIALQALPAKYDSVAWLDCDVIFPSNHWIERAGEALRRHPLVHLFRDRHDLPRDSPLDKLSEWAEPYSSQSLVYRLHLGAATAADFNTSSIVYRGVTKGLAWAARRELLVEHGFYDACVVGGGDMAILFAALGEFERAVSGLQMNARRREHYLAWARPFHRAIRGRVGYIDGSVFTLWHGEKADRHYTDRHQILRDFDPVNDLTLSEQGSWRWASHKPELQAAVRDYFSARREDGASSESQSST